MYSGIVLHSRELICEEREEAKLLPTDSNRKRGGKLSLSELMKIVLFFYLSPCKYFKNYYLYHLAYKYKGYFRLPSYSRVDSYGVG